MWNVPGTPPPLKIASYLHMKQTFSFTKPHIRGFKQNSQPIFIANRLEIHVFLMEIHASQAMLLSCLCTGVIFFFLYIYIYTNVAP